MNSISGKRYKSLANSYAKTPRGRANRSKRADTPVRLGNTRRLPRSGASGAGTAAGYVQKKAAKPRQWLCGPEEKKFTLSPV